MKFAWKVADPQPELAGRLARELSISPLFAQCLVNRGLCDPQEAARFLNPRLKNLADPFLLPNMAAAVERLLAARARGELLLIFGDYDVDGVSATALLCETLGALGWKVEHHLPDRLDEGYGLSREAIDHCRRQFPLRLVLAVDCGSTAFEVISALRDEGVDVIVLDHHQVSAPPPAVALVNPQLGDAFRELCSAGLAFKLAHAVVKRLREAGEAAALQMDLRLQLDLVALGTIADLVPLRGENRILVAGGLDRLETSARPGLRALRDVAGITRPIGVYEVGFQLAPRLNAAGRIENAQGALQLLLTRDPAEARTLAAALDQQNRQRQAIERSICDEVTALVRARFDAERHFVIVEGRSEWHIGVVGIVASRVLNEFYRPTILLGGDSAGWRGSGRSIEGFDLAAALRQCGEFLTRHGGHAMAAGLSMDAVHLDRFRERLNELARTLLRPEHLRPCLKLDAAVAISELSVEQVDELARLEPTGQGNPAAKLAVRGVVQLQPPQLIGQQSQHVKFRLANGVGAVEAVWWNGGGAAQPEHGFDLAAIPAINEFRGWRTVQLKVLDWQPPGP